MRKRSIEDWKSALMTLPESNFFELLRSVFGNIKTPFNKQRLLEDLAGLLSRDEIRNVITAYINEQDHKIIAAVALLDEPAPEILETFFAGELSYAELHALLVNLEERLIIYRFRNDEGLHLALNPVLEEVFTPFIEDTSPVFRSFPASQNENSAGTETSEKGNAGGISNSRYLAALITFFRSGEELFRAEAGTLGRGTGNLGIRKKILERGKKTFPSLDLDLALRILLVLGLFGAEDRRLIPCEEKIAAFCALSSLERQEYWAAGMYLCLDETSSQANQSSDEVSSIFTTISRNRLRKIASSIHHFRACMEPGRKYPETTLRRLKMLLEKDAGNSGGISYGSSGSKTAKTWGYPLFDDHILLPFEPLLLVTEKAGLLEKDGNLWKASPAEREAPPDGTGPVIAMDSAFSIVLYPELKFADAIALGAFCAVKENDGTACMELSRESAVRGFDSGLKAADMVEILDRLSGSRLDANLGWTLEEWENRYTGVLLDEGIILTLSEDRRYLAGAKPVSSLIRKTLAPGVYLLSSAERAEAAAALKKAGVDIIAQPLPQIGEKGRGVYSGALLRAAGRDSFPHLDLYKALRPLPVQTSPAVKKKLNKVLAGKTEEVDSILENFHRILENMKTSRQEREELSARIERRLVLSEAQLESASLKYEKTEARALDYQGKISIAKQAVQTGALLEISLPGPGGETRRIMGIAQALEKKEGDTILVLRDTKRDAAETDRTHENTIRVPLGKISLLRRIKQSIFGE